MTDLRHDRPLSGIDIPTRRPAVTVSIALAGALAVIALGFGMKSGQADQGAVVALNAAHTGAWGAFSRAVYQAIGPVPAVAITLAIAGGVWAISRSLRTALLFGLTVAFTWLPVAAIKILVDRPRPDASLLAHPFSPLQTDASFPSGHTAYVVALAVSFWFLLRGTGYAWLAVVSGIAATALIGLAVVGDGLHFPTDVLGSILWALSTAAAVRWLIVDVIAARIGRGRSSAAR